MGCVVFFQSVIKVAFNSLIVTSLSMPEVGRTPKMSKGSLVHFWLLHQKMKVEDLIDMILHPSRLHPSVNDIQLQI